MLSSKVSVVDNIIKALNTKKNPILTVLTTHPAPPKPLKPFTLVPIIDRMFLVKQDFTKNNT